MTSISFIALISLLVISPVTAVTTDSISIALPDTAAHRLDTTKPDQPAADIGSSSDTVKDSAGGALSVSDTLMNIDSLLESGAYDSILKPDSGSVQGTAPHVILKKPVKPRPYLYPGITEEQDRLAKSMTNSIYSFDWDAASRTGKKMQRLERKNNLPPLSSLFQVAMAVTRLQNNEFPDHKTGKQLYEDVERNTKEGLTDADPARHGDSLLLTNLLITGGIRGFRATLKIRTNPVEAALDGLKALKLLEKVTGTDPRIKDAYLGLGIFYCALAKAPAIVRSALNMTGRDISFDKGLDYLRISAYEGCYTKVIAQEYLIQFLTPYFGHLVLEKKAIFRSLQHDYPRNPYYVFLELDEGLCFYPDRMFENAGRDLFRKKVRLLRADNYSTRRYLELVKWQCSLLHPDLGIKPDNGFDLREFVFYPVFLQTLRLKLETEASPMIKASQAGKRNALISDMGKLSEKTMKLLTTSSMGPNRKGFYEWHVRDALRTE